MPEWIDTFLLRGLSFLLVGVLYILLCAVWFNLI